MPKIKPMTNIKSLAYTVLMTGTVFCFSSCSKNIDEQGISKNGDPSQLASLPSCSTPAPAFIGLQINNGSWGSKYFYYGTKSVVANRQPFAEASFPDQRFMELTAEVDPDRPQTGSLQVLAPLAPIHFGGRQRIGVFSTTPSTKFYDLGDAIRPGEALVLKLGTDVATKKMWKIKLFIQGSGVADIELWDNATKKGEIPVTLTGATQSVEFSTAPSNAFNTIKLKCQSGNYGIKGLGGDSEFYLIESIGSFIGMSFNLGPNNRYLFRNSVGTALNDRQVLQGGTQEVDFNSPTINGNKWMNVSTTGGDLYFYLDGSLSNLGVSGLPWLARLDANESIIFEPGPDFGSTQMRMAEFTQSRAGVLRAETFLNNASQGVFLSNGIVGSTFLVGNTKNFDKVVLSRSTGSPALGVSGTSVRFYQACL